MIGLMGAPGVDVQANGRARQPFGGTAGDGDRRERGVAISGDPGRVIGPQRRADAGNATPLIMGAVGYLILFIPFVLFGRWVETRFAWKR